MAEIINIEKQMFLSNEITKVYYSSNMLTNFQDFSSDYVKNYNSARSFLDGERKREEQAPLSFDMVENNRNFLPLIPYEAMEELAIKIVNTYYSSSRFGGLNEFASEYVNSYALARMLVQKEKQKEEQLLDSFDGFENVCDAIRLLTRDGIEHLSLQIVDTYYCSGRLGDFNEFVSEYLNNYRLSSKTVKNNREELSENSKLFR